MRLGKLWILDRIEIDIDRCTNLKLSTVYERQWSTVYENWGVGVNWILVFSLVGFDVRSGCFKQMDKCELYNLLILCCFVLFYLT